MGKWISLRNRWPEEAGTYRVRNCRHDVEGSAVYDGFNFEHWEPDPPLRYGLMYIEYIVTHWMENEE